MKLLLFFACIFAYKLLKNAIKFCKIVHYRSEFYAFLDDKPNNINQFKVQTIELFKDAGVGDMLIPVTQAAGYGQIASMNASIYTNFPSKKIVIAEASSQMIENTVGVYRSRILECFNPLYWIDAVLFLPKNILLYIGLDPEKAVYKLCNVIISFIWWLLGAAFLFFRTALLDLAIKFLGNLK